MRAPALLLLCASLGATASAATLRVTVGGERGAVDVLAGTRTTTADAPRWLVDRHLGAGEREARFDALPAGITVVLVRGAGPLERHAAQLRLAAEADERVDVTITPVLLRVRLAMDGAPLAGASVDLDRTDDLWSGSVTADRQGVFTTPLWQQGAFRAYVRGGGLRSTVPAAVTLAGTKSIDWSFEVPPRTIRGRVVDGSGTPVADAAVVLMQTNDTARQTRRMNSAADGTFEFRGVLRGSHSLRVVTSPLLHSPPVPVEIGERDVKSVTIALRAGVARELAVVGADGAPIANARVLCATGADVRALATTDTRGHATIATPDDEPSVLFAFPPGGSLAVRRVGERDERVPLRIVVPRGDSSLEVAALATDGGALPGLYFLVRLDGEVVPPEVIRASRREDIVLDTGEEGRCVSLQRIPSGHYELWPYRNDEEARAMIASSLPAKSSVSLDITPGAHRVTLRFRRNHSAPQSPPAR